jgi:hypothetical protein
MASDFHRPMSLIMLESTRSLSNAIAPGAESDLGQNVGRLEAVLGAQLDDGPTEEAGDGEGLQGKNDLGKRRERCLPIEGIGDGGQRCGRGR